MTQNDHNAEPPRPDPDRLLEAVQQEESRRTRGKLKIFFGMCAGVGKTFEMLKAAQLARVQKIDTVIALVETHGRPETASLLEGFEVLPRRTSTYRSTRFEEMDLDAVLARRPRLVLVDELAHTNVPGSRHPKRYQDVLEILENGIDVYTTLNVQHIDSRADTVARITGIIVHETVPDSVFDLADEIEIIDISEEVLLQRFSEGKIYTADQSQQALRNFFRRGNIKALREMALRITAERVDQELNAYMALKAMQGPFRIAPRILVGIDSTPQSGELIRWVRRIAYSSKAEWIALHVDTGAVLRQEEQDQLSANMQLAASLGAEVITTAALDVAEELLRIARDRNVTQIVVGKSRAFLTWTRFSIAQKLLRISRDIDIYVSAFHQKRQTSAPLFRIPRRQSTGRHYTYAAALILSAAAVCFPLSSVLGYETVGILLLMLTTLLSLFLGIGPVLLAATLSALLWNFLFIPPLFTVAIAKLEDVFLFIAYFVFASITGILNARIRQQRRLAEYREEKTEALYRLTSEISSARTQDQIFRTAVAHLRRILNAEVIIFQGDLEGEIPMTPHPASTFGIDEKEFAVAAWSYWNERQAGRYTTTLPDTPTTYFPLKGSRYVLAVVGLRWRDSRPLTERSDIVDNCLIVLSTALEREFLNELTKKASVDEASDRLYRTLFSSISHELRTPIASILGSTESLFDPKIRGEHSVASELLKDIHAAGQRLNRLVSNLLDMTRLEANKVVIRPDWTDIHDLVANTLRTFDPEASGRAVQLLVPDDLPLVFVDAGLLEQAVVNLLHNASTYTPPGCVITLEAEYHARTLRLRVADNGQGFPPDSLPLLFNKFYRIPGTRSGGTGLGLSIVKGFVEAHHGTVIAENKLGGGAMVTIAIPCDAKRIEDIGTPE